MSSSEEESSADKNESCKVEASNTQSKMLFVSLLKNHRVVLNKYMLPKMVAAKEKACNEIKDQYSKGIGKVITIAQLKKLLKNMKTNIKKKTDTNARGNNPMKVNKWESEFL
ncbi:unnamed protein product [Acanthoscelides obtectus]|uniref:Regulatory protein zeste n=1 Tax=Acanthoscelides obtectus TaxID=200917 RepID=A0A9P0LF50_ACAOB|nr:unnamed protein product [Acanthoscelides obtectus]CAK1655727.1 hypothetical protein AOBTE_LOCUS19284 [Acanthoscelides obtectus]